MDDISPFPAREPVLIKVPTTTVSQTRERLLDIQVAIEFALHVLNQTKNHDDETVLDSVADVLRVAGTTRQWASELSPEEIAEAKDRIASQFGQFAGEELEAYFMAARKDRDAGT